MQVTFGPTDIDDKDIQEFSNLLGTTIVLEDNILKFFFDNVAQACNYCSNMNTIFFPNEQGYVIGNEDDDVVKEYPLFRLPTTLYHIVSYYACGRMHKRGNLWVLEGWEKSSTPEELLLWFDNAVSRLLYPPEIEPIDDWMQLHDVSIYDTDEETNCKR